MEAKELRTRDEAELRTDLEKLRREIFDLRFKSRTEGLSNPSRIPLARKDVARILTVLREKQGAKGGPR
ncbi:MAG TPA: 50S ribosomal protein L29 [Planctomycetota bacterium]|jgi:large subunit ribosomal protein L29|nr:50S ribosomal protein L29 [Planctomycetota bacterium]